MTRFLIARANPHADLTKRLQAWVAFKLPLSSSCRLPVPSNRMVFKSACVYNRNLAACFHILLLTSCLLQNVFSHSKKKKKTHHAFTAGRVGGGPGGGGNGGSQRPGTGGGGGDRGISWLEAAWMLTLRGIDTEEPTCSQEPLTYFF